MQKVEEQLDRFLPYGENLQAILNHPSITKSDIKSLLRLKGIFLDDVSNETTFPLLSTLLLDPSEFDYLKDKLQSREDKEKIFTRELEWSSNDSLVNSLPENFKIQDILGTSFVKYKVLGSPDFSMIQDNPDKVSLKFKCETFNYNQAWFRIKNEFSGEVILQKLPGKGNRVQIQIIHTSPETTDVSNRVVRHLERHFKENGHMDARKEIRGITFGDFTNEERMGFFLSLTEGNDIFEFLKSIKVDIGPAEGIPLPSEIDWMALGQVRDLEINGDILHEIDFIKDKSKHKFLEVCSMELEFVFRYPSAEGKCRINFGFNGYFKKKDSKTEFGISVVKIVQDEAYLTVPINRIQKYLLEEFESLKIEKFNWVEYQALYSQHTP